MNRVEFQTIYVYIYIFIFIFRYICIRLYIYKLEKVAPQQRPRAHTHPAYTSIHTNQSRSKTYKHIHKTKQKQNTQNIQATPSQQHPTKQHSKKYITLYNSKYCIRVVLRKKIDGIFCTIFFTPLVLPVCQKVLHYQNRSNKKQKTLAGCASQTGGCHQPLLFEEARIRAGGNKFIEI